MPALEMWCECPRQGRVLRGFLPHKLPLDEATSEQLSLDEGDRFTPTMLVERQIHAKAPIGLAISLLVQPPRAPSATAGAGPSAGGIDPWAAVATEWEDWDVEFASVPCVAPLAVGAAGVSGFSEQLPPPQLVSQFVERCAAFWAVSSGGASEPGTNAYRTIAVHCNTGYNVSGYMICHFLIATHRVPAQRALAAFAEARPPGVYHRAFVEGLFRFHRQVVPSPDGIQPGAWAMPEAWPQWHARLHDEELALVAANHATGGARGASGGGAAGKATAALHPPRPPVPMFAPPPAGAGGPGGTGAAAAQPTHGAPGSQPAAAAAGAGAGGKRARPVAATEPPLPRILHPLPGGAAGWRSFGTPVLGGTRARTRRICCQLVGLPLPADTPSASASAAAAASAEWAPLGFGWGEPAALTSAGLHGELRKQGDKFLVALEPLLRPLPGSAAAAAAAVAAAGAGEAAAGEGAGAPAAGGLRCVVLWLEGKAYVLLESPVCEQGHDAPLAPVAPGGGALPAGAGADVWLLAPLQLPGMPDRSLLVGALAPPSAADGARRWRLCVREALAIGGRSLAGDALERRLAQLQRHALEPRKGLAAEQLALECVSLLAQDFFRTRRTQVRPALSAQFEVGLLVFRRKRSPYPLPPPQPTAAAAATDAQPAAEAAAFGWPAGARQQPLQHAANPAAADGAGGGAAADAAVPTEAELRACEWLRQ
ncbi:hypothetical protein T492DRAFT_1148734 [Pavlovales sp. CCMP2436]|nr:hypothetical protein T492DRAFT_1148734 [Pavlovales sp. CCMP2436]